MTIGIFKKINVYYWSVFGIILLLFLFLQYFGLFYYQYQTPFGDDGAIHLRIINEIISNNRSIFNSDYPLFYHYLVIFLSNIFHLSPLSIMTYFSPIILPLCGISFFICSYFLFNPKVALVSFFLYAFVSQISIQLYIDGGYPNLISVHLFSLLVLTLIGLMERSEAINPRLYLLLLLLFILIIFTHHFSFVFLLITFFISALLFIIIKYRQLKSPIFHIIGLFLLLLAVLITVFYYAPSRAIIETFISWKNVFPFFEINGKAQVGSLWELSNYSQIIGYPIMVLAFLGMPYFIFCNKYLNKNLFIKIFVPLWMISLIVASQFNFLPNPERLARDSLVPMIIIASFFIVFLHEKIRQKQNQNILPLSVLLFALIFCQPVIKRFQRAVNYEAMQRFTSADEEIYHNLSNQQAGKVIYTSWNLFLEHKYDDNWEFTNLFDLPKDQQDKIISANNQCETLINYDYLYLISDVKAWLPAQVKTGYEEKLAEASCLKLIEDKQSNNNRIRVYTIKNRNR